MVNQEPNDILLRPINPLTVVFVLFTCAALVMMVIERDRSDEVAALLAGVAFGLFGLIAAFWESGNWHYIVRGGKPLMVRSWPRLELDVSQAESILYRSKCYFQIRGHPRRRVKLVMIYGIGKKGRHLLEGAFRRIAEGPEAVHLVGLERRKR